MAERQLTLPGPIVKKSNALARARWSAESVWEPRLVAFLASKVRQDDTDFQVYEIPAAEIMRSTGGKDYREIEAVVDRVMSRVLTIRDDAGWTKYNVFSRCRYRAKDAVLELGFHPDLRPHYLNLKQQFAKYNLFEYLRLPSTYSQRLFEYLKSWDDTPEVIIALEELYEMLQAPLAMQRYSDFRRFVLERAHRDISKLTSLYYEWEPVKKGRSVVAIRFSFSPKKREIAAQKKESGGSVQNNKLMLAASSCWKRGKGQTPCPNVKPTSKKCGLCLRLIQKS